MGALDPTAPVPAVYFPQRRVRIAVAANAWVAGLVAVAGGVLLVLEAMAGFPDVGYRFGVAIPMGVVYAVLLVFGVGYLVAQARKGPGYRAWSLVELLDRPDGLVLRVGRLGPRHEGLLVRRGETIEIAASQGYRTSYLYVVTAPAGTMKFDADGYVHKLTMQPLEEAAARHGITVVTTGKAERIPRTVTALP